MAVVFEMTEKSNSQISELNKLHLSNSSDIMTFRNNKGTKTVLQEILFCFIIIVNDK